MSKKEQSTEEKISIFEIKNMMQELYFMMDDPDIDSEIIMDTMEGLTGTAEQKVEGYGYVIKKLDNDITYLKDEIKRLQGKIKTIENNQTRLKGNIIDLFEVMNIKKMKTASYTFSVVDGKPSVVIDNDKKIPKIYKKPQPDKIDNAAIKEYLKKHGSTDYAHLEIGDCSLSIR